MVTGGASGIGRAAVQLLEQEGVSVAVLDRAAETGPVDVSDPEAVRAAVDEARRRLGPIGIVVNAAGVASAGRLDDDRFPEEWERAISINLSAAMHVVRACLPDLMSSGQGRIVNVASTEGLGAARWMGPYSVSKHGLVGFTRSLAVDLGRSGITANCICPGATLTGMTGGIPEGDRDTFARRHIPVGRYARPEEIAYMIVALTRPEASFVNGSVITVDGGQMAMNN